MSASFEVKSSSGTYEVQIQRGALGNYLGSFHNASVIADDFFRQTLETLAVPATFVEATEANKSLDASPSIIERLRKSGVNRQTELVAMGGGIVQDLSAFIASVYMRGLTWSYLPTTVLAMVDSCIGGKSSINVGPYKNLVGTFHPPKLVLIDPSLAQTLTKEEKASGLIEAAKICFCHGPESFDRHIACKPSVSIGTEALESLIVNSLESKKWFIEVDEFDKKERLLLNFGHTFGHAIEGASHFAISHGIAVGLGILCALFFERACGTDYSASPRVKMLEDHLQEMVCSIHGLSDTLRTISLDDVLERFASDKKHGTDHYTVVVVTADGTVVLRKIGKTPEVARTFRKAVQSIVERFG
jgi:3-dehydroquinate synthase